MHLEPIIGLEIHLQIKTTSKMFCRCPVTDGAPANTVICPVCSGHPGTLPVPNEEAIRAIIRLGLALGAKIAPHSKFDRKQYFYPDLPKGYQVSQFDLPIVSGGFLDIHVPKGKRTNLRIGITRAHLEEDAAKSFHGSEKATFVDLNRAGTALIETVSEPDMRSPEEAKAFLQELRLIARTIGISDADMEKGQMRCDANISLREIDENGNPISKTLNPKTEIKNMNSFRAVERALAYEIKRQTELWETSGAPQETTTRGWNDDKQITELQRVKESFGDYRFFPDPDLPPLALSDLAEELASSIPELPAVKRKRFMDEYYFNYEEACYFCEHPEAANYIEHVISELVVWLNTLPELEGITEEELWETQGKKLARLLSGWFISKLGGILNERNLSIQDTKMTPENFAEFICLLSERRLSATNGLEVLQEMIANGKDPSHIMEDRNYSLLDDGSAIAEAIDRIIAAHPQEAERFRRGEKQLLGFFMGRVMKETKGKADPGLTENMLKVVLEQGL